MLITDQKSRSYGNNNNGDMNKTDLSKVGNVPSTVLETPARECVNLDCSRMKRYAYNISQNQGIVLVHLSLNPKSGLHYCVYFL